jgi:peptidoglycan/LPS O-acetylase OafA/YrhL
MHTMIRGEDDFAHVRVPALDGIRGIAIIWVVLHNAMDIPVAASTGLYSLVNVLAHAGWIGVQLFFGLSGFLITYGLLEAQGRTGFFRNFYARRALRILPLYYGVLLALLVIAPLVPALHWPYGFGGHVSLWLFLVNWTHDAPYGFAHFWSLAVEEQFYLLWPFLVWRLATRRLIWACIGISIAALALRSLMVGYGVDPWTLYTNTACRMDALALGAAGACLLRDSVWRAWVQVHSRRILLLAAALFIAGLPVTHIYDRYGAIGETLGYTLLAVCAAALVVCAAVPGRMRGVRAVLAWAPLRSIGKYSYGIYIFHGLLNKLLGEPWLNVRFGPLPATSVVLLYALALLGVSYALALCSYHLLERHFIRLKAYFEPGEAIAAC